MSRDGSCPEPVHRYRKKVAGSPVRLGGWVPYKPDYSLHDGEMMVVTIVES
jgi:hypothetical protein